MNKTKTVWNTSDASPTDSQESPLEPGVYHLPAGAVDSKPPVFDPLKKVCSWNGDRWVVSSIPVPEPEPEPEPYVETYVDKRRFAYGSPESQIEFITEKGLAAWKTKVSEIKLKHPKE